MCEKIEINEFISVKYYVSCDQKVERTITHIIETRFKVVKLNRFQAEANNIYIFCLNFFLNIFIFSR